MRILINTASTFKGGGIQVAKSFIEECKHFSDNAYFVVLSEPLSRITDINAFSENFTFLNAPFRPATRFFSFKSHNRFLKDAEEVFKPDVVFTTSGPSYWRPKAPHLMGYNIPHYIYPESPYFNMISFKRRLWWKAMKIFAHYNFKNNADAYVVQTDDVNERLKKFLNKATVYTVYNTINVHYLNDTKAPNKLPKKNRTEFRLLTLSAWYPHKNFNIIFKVIEELRKVGETNIKFIVTLKESDFNASRLVTIPEVINVGPVKIEDAPSLYKECDAMFLPTLLECFSASYVEAMKMQKPILTSNLGFAHTICKDAAVYFDPINPLDIANTISRVKNSSKLQDELIQKGTKRLKIFGTPYDRAKKYLEICNLITNRTNT